MWQDQHGPDFYRQGSPSSSQTWAPGASFNSEDTRSPHPYSLPSTSASSSFAPPMYPQQDLTFIQQTYVPIVPSQHVPPQTHGNRDFIAETFAHGQRLGKPSGACTRCKKLKMKCELRSGETKCQRCKGGNYDCIPARRRPRRPKAPPQPTAPTTPSTVPTKVRRISTSPSSSSNSDEELPANCPMGVIAAMGSDTDTEDTAVGAGYFPRPHPKLDLRVQEQAPILELVDLATARVLFDFFVQWINPSAAILDPQLHTFDYVHRRSGFLLTVLCTIASRFHGTDPTLYTRAMDTAKRAAARALVSDAKSVEAVQAYILLSLYGAPARRFEEDRGWLYSGLAIRMATDLHLHRPAKGHDREAQSRDRVWRVCFNLDRSFATQLGRPPAIIAEEKRLTEPGDDPYDLTSCAFADMMTVMSRFQEAFGQGKDVQALTVDYDRRLDELVARWQPQLVAHHPDYPGVSYRAYLFPFCTAYSRLVMHTFAFQDAFDKGTLTAEAPALRMCFNAASTVIQMVTQHLAPAGYYKYAFHSHFVYVTFAAAFLLKLLRPAFAPILAPGQREQIASLVRDVVHTFGSPQVAADEQHAPRHYARFLKTILARYTRSQKPSQAMPPPPVPQQQQPLQPGQQQQLQQQNFEYFPTQAFPSATGGAEFSFFGDALSSTSPPPPAAADLTSSMGVELISPTTADPNLWAYDNLHFGVDPDFPMSGDLMSTLWWEQFRMPGFWECASSDGSSLDMSPLVPSPTGGLRGVGASPTQGMLGVGVGTSPTLAMAGAAMAMPGAPFG